MTIRALRFASDQSAAMPAQSDLPAESSQAFVRALPAQRPVAFVIRNQDVDTLVQFKGVTVDCRKKNPAKQLALRLLGQEKIPVMRGSYRNWGQLARSVRTLLANAVRANERNVYIVGAGEEVFEELWDQAGASAAKKKRRQFGEADGVSEEM